MPRRSSSDDSLSNNYIPSEPQSAGFPDVSGFDAASVPSSSVGHAGRTSVDMNQDYQQRGGGGEYPPQANGGQPEQRQRFRRSVFGQRQAAQNQSAAAAAGGGGAQSYSQGGGYNNGANYQSPAQGQFQQVSRDNSYNSFSLRPPALPFAAGSGPQPSPSMTSIASDGSKDHPISTSLSGNNMHQRRSVNPNGSGATTPRGVGDRSSILASSSSARRDSKTQSLSLNYLPTKFAKLHSQGDWAHRRKRGGGRAAFADDAGRMGLDGYGEDEGEGIAGMEGGSLMGDGSSIAGGSGTGVAGGANGRNNVRFGDGGNPPERHDSQRGLVGGRKGKKFKLRWNRFKWALFITNTILMIIALAILISSLLVWFDVFYRADVIRTANRMELIISTAAGALCILTAMIGFAGIILNNRAFLAVYSLFLWFCFALIVVPGYLTYKKRTFNLEGKINAQWSTGLGLLGRLKLQNQLDCCGYYTPFSEATASNLCYSRSILPGCKAAFLKYERSILESWYICSFVLVPVIIAIIVTALLSSNHVTYRFGKGLTPKRYRLDDLSMAVIMDEYASEIAEQFGQGIAQEALNRSSSYGDINEKNYAGSIDPRSRASSFVSYK